MTAAYPPSCSSLSAGRTNFAAAALAAGMPVSSRSQSTAMRSRCATARRRLAPPNEPTTTTKAAKRARIGQAASLAVSLEGSLGASAGPHRRKRLLHRLQLRRFHALAADQRHGRSRSAAVREQKQNIGAGVDSKESPRPPAKPGDRGEIPASRSARMTDAAEQGRQPAAPAATPFTPEQEARVRELARQEVWADQRSLREIQEASLLMDSDRPAGMAALQAAYAKRFRA